MLCRDFEFSFLLGKDIAQTVQLWEYEKHNFMDAAVPKLKSDELTSVFELVIFCNPFTFSLISFC